MGLLGVNRGFYLFKTYSGPAGPTGCEAENRSLEELKILQTMDPNSDRNQNRARGYTLPQPTPDGEIMMATTARPTWCGLDLHLKELRTADLQKIKQSNLNKQTSVVALGFGVEGAQDTEDRQRPGASSLFKMRR
ncbi:hypothetical protein AVEN_93433-1 [Araneus ventricosus]|uniref:Uncharacterized protein n=1 Tax=Araneus ventricosus TaxID=182803 RepID=A0A4Y2AR24_ARAVE|nr:hypothetical protein AVEN_93433-1 [Araneus ventricosus]